MLNGADGQGPGLQAQLLLRRGVRRVFFGRAAAAEPDLREVIAFAGIAGDTLMECRALRWLGVAMEAMGRRPEACELLSRGLTLATAAGDSATIGWSLVGLAYQANMLGRSGEALEQYERAGGVFAALGDLEGESWAQNGRGMALTSQGEYFPALAAFRAAHELARRRVDPLGEAMALNNIATLEYSLGDPGAALEAFERSLKLQKDAGNLRQAVTPLINVALCYGKLGNRDSAESALQEALRICRDQKYYDLEAVTLSHLARLSREFGRPREAAQRYEQALELASYMSLQAHVTAIMGLSDVMDDLQDYERALAYVDRAETVITGASNGDAWPQIDQQRGALLSRAGQPGEGLPLLVRGTRRAAERGLDYYHMLGLVEQARAHRSLAQPDSALAALEQAARVWEAMRAAPLDPVWREQRGALGRNIGTELAATLLEAPDQAEDERVRSAFDRLQLFKTRTLQERITGPASLPAVTDLATLAALQGDVLRPGELFLDAYVGTKASFIFAVTRETCQARPLPPGDELGGILRRYRELVAVPAELSAQSVSGAALRATTQRLTELVFGELAAQIAGAQRVFISPDGPLNLVPLGLLIDDGSPETSAADAGYGREWVRVPSATLLQWLRAQSQELAEPGTRPMCVIADTTGGDGRALRGVVEEVEALQRIARGAALHAPWVPGTPLTIEELSRAGTIHVAAHFRADDQSPWQSKLPIMLDRPERGLRAGEIAAMSLAADLVVLSSCESAGGQILSGEGVLGICQAFLSAGAGAVVATLWPVDDRGTARFMEHFYRELARGETVASALQLAQVAVRARPGMHHPFYWAGFVVVGDGDVRVSLPHPSPMNRASAAALLLFGGMAVALLASWRITVVRRRVRAG